MKKITDAALEATLAFVKAGNKNGNIEIVIKLESDVADANVTLEDGWFESMLDELIKLRTHHKGDRDE